MNFLLPGFIAAGVLVGLPILLHLIRKKPQHYIPFPSLRFLGPRILRDTKRHRILRWILLAMRCALIALVVAAFARPFFAQKLNRHGRAVIVAVDNSFSMQTSDRWSVLLKWVRSQIDDLNPGDQIGVMLMNPSPSWVIPMTGEIETARVAINSMKPGWQTTRYNGALHLASETLRALPVDRRELVWMADEQFTGWREVNFSNPLPPGVKVIFAPVQPLPKRQAAISAIQVRPDGKGLVVEVTVQPFVPEKDTRQLTLFLSGSQVGQKKVQLEAGHPATVTFPVENKGSVLMLKAILDADDLPADDTAYAMFDPDAGVPTWLAPSTSGEETDFIACAMESTKLQDLQGIRPLPLPESEWPDNGVAVLRGGAPFQGTRGAKLVDFIKKGGAAWIMISGEPDQIAWLKAQGIQVTPRSGPLQLRDLDFEHPLFEVFAKGQMRSLLSLSFNSGWGIEGAEVNPIARWTDRSNAMVETRIGDGQLLVTGFEPTRHVTSLPLTPAFVPWVHRAVMWLSQNGHESRELLRVGEPISLPSGEGIWRSLDSPEVQAPIKVSGSVIPMAPGLYQFKSEKREKLFAVNLPIEESDLTPYPNLRELSGLQSKQPAEKAGDVGASIPEERVEQQSSVWWWLLLIAVVLLLSELTLSSRTAL